METQEKVEWLHKAKPDGPANFASSVLIPAVPESVWHALTEPEHLHKFFGMIPERSLSHVGKQLVRWDDGIPDEIDVLSVVPLGRVIFDWNAYKQPYRTTVTFAMAPVNGKVKVTVSERGWELTPEGLESAFANCDGWSEFGVRLQMYLEHGI